MLFNSQAFAIFLPIVFLLYWNIPHKYRWGLLLISSYYFYMSWNPKYIFLILLTTAVSYGAARLLEHAESNTHRKCILYATVFVCLGTLFVFKYFNFFSENLTYIFQCFSIPLHPATANLLLPVGISFYTFQTLSYVFDVYKKKILPEHHFGIFATFISFFPQLVAGPIERSVNLLPQINSEKNFRYDDAVYGLRLMAWGFFKKLAIADVLAVYVDAAYSSLSTCTGLDLLCAIFFFTIQIYCDFSGYSDIARGTAKLLGINLMTNFASPYFSASVKEFWARWHISLSTWFRDYVYIPLGGNRCSALKHSRNLLITFLISGLWHGANWTFVLWGGVHGAALIAENRLKSFLKIEQKYLRAISIPVTFLFCNFAWILFRANNFSEFTYILTKLTSSMNDYQNFIHTNIGLSIPILLNIFVSLIILTLYDFISLKTDIISWIGQKHILLRWCIYFAIIFYTILSMPLEASSFIYFQF